MVPIPVSYTMSDEGLMTAVFRACSKTLYYQYDREGMNRRDLLGKLDDKIMGTCAEISLKEHLDRIGVRSFLYDDVRANGFRNIDPGWDIAFGDPSCLRIVGGIPTVSPGIYTGSVRSSRLPKVRSGKGWIYKTIDNAIGNYDFKILGHKDALDNMTPIVDEMKADIELQIYYEHDTFPSGEITIDQIQRCVDNNDNCQDIIDRFNVHGRYGRCYLTAWNFKRDILDFSATLPPERRYWVSLGKPMWKAPLNRGRSIDTLRDLNRIQ